MILRKNKFFILAVIIILGLFYRIYLFESFPYISFDSAEYLRLGKNLIEYGNYSFSHDGKDNIGVIFPPGYPLFIGLANIILANLFISGTVVSILAGTMSIYLIFLVAKHLINEEAGLFAAFVLAICSPIADFSAKVMSESLFILFILVSIFLFIKNNKNFSFPKSFFLGVIIGFVFLTKPEGILFFLLIPASFYIIKKKDKVELKKIAAGLLLSIMSFILVISPYIFFIKEKTGNFSLSGKSGVNIATGEFLNGRSYSQVPAKEYYQKFYGLNGRSEELSTSLYESAVKNPVGFLYRYFKNIELGIRELLLYFLPTPLILLIFLSLSSKKIYKKPEIRALLIISVLFMLILPLYQVRQRYLFPVFIFLILVSSSSFIFLEETAKKFFLKRRKYFSSLFWRDNTNFICKNIKKFTILLLLAGAFFPLVKYYHPVAIEHKKAGEFLKNNINYEYEGINVMTIKPYVCFYANSRCTSIPFAEVDKVKERARDKKVDYIVVDERYLGFSPYYQELFCLDQDNNKYQLIYEDKNPTSLKIFKVLNTSL